MSALLIPSTSPIRLTRQGAALRCAYQQGLAIRQELPPRETGASQRANPCGSHAFQADSTRVALRGVFQTNPPGGRFAVCLPAGTGSRLRSSPDTGSGREHPARARSLPRGGPPGLALPADLSTSLRGCVWSSSLRTFGHSGFDPHGHEPGSLALSAIPRSFRPLEPILPLPPSRLRARGSRPSCGGCLGSSPRAANGAGPGGTP